MSDSPLGYSTSNGVDRNTLSATNKEAHTISHQVKRQRTKNKLNKSTTEFHSVSNEQKRGKKRKSEELLENKTERVIKHRDISDSVSEQSNHVQFKRPRITPHTLTAEAESACWEVDPDTSPGI